jgi:putative cell wall-binding protein
LTTTKKRRGKRSLAAILAAMLMASVLAVVAGSPAQAANTSFEVKVDHDNNAATDMVREFAGQDRYDTALRLAKNFATSKGGLGAVPSAFVASGESLIDSISVAGLAGYVDAPILLTPSDSLHGGVADFIEDYGVSTVYVLGGSAAVADSVVTAIEGLSAKPKATRIAGDDRYATAAATASMIDAESSWCDTDAVSAVLINGGSDMLSYGVAVQTIAYRLQLPVLMTATDELPDATAEYITDNDVEHVQIIGGTGAVSADVASALTTLGVDTVDRVDGDSASAVSVELAKTAGNGCGDDLGLVSSDRVALVRGNPDGVVAAPVLASSLAGGYLVPPLVVGDSLPASVRDYLAATPKNIGPNKLNLGIVAIGGPAAVSEATMKAALEKAASSGALTVAIGATTDVNKDGATNGDDPVRPDTTTEIVTTEGSEAGPMIALYFSDAVTATDNVERIKDVIKINKIPAVVLNAAGNAGTGCDQTRIDVTLGQHLRDGDVISIDGSSVKLGTSTDQRTFGSDTEKVTAAAPDRVRPMISIVGIAGAATPRSTFEISFADNVGLVAVDGIGQLENDEIRIVGGPGGTSPAPTVTVVHTAGAATAVATVSRPLVVGDRLIVNPGAVEDAAGNKSAGTSGAAIKAQASPRINQVLMSNLKHTAHAMWTVPAASVSGVNGTGAGITIRAKGDGDAAGAAGNDWSMVFDRASTYSTQKPLDIDVSVDPKGKRVTVRFNNGPTTATLGDLIAALNADAEFSALFSAGFTSCSEAATNNASRAVLGLLAARNVAAGFNDSGRTQFAIEVKFNAFVDAVRNPNLLEDLLAATRVRTRPSAAESVTAGNTRVQAAATGGDNTAAGGGLTIQEDLSADSTALPNVDTSAAPTRSVRYEFETSQVRYLPMERDLVQTAEGHAGATAIVGPPAFPAITADVGVATGYAADAPTGADNTGAQDKVDENLNGPSQNRIAVSTGVKAPS